MTTTPEQALDRIESVLRHFGGDVARIRRILDEVEIPDRGRDPMRDLDDAVRAMHEHDGRTVSGWVLAVATTRIEADTPPGLEPVNHGGGYSLGPGTSPAAALGLSDGLAALLRRIVRQELTDEE